MIYRGIFVTGTDTGVGKTSIACGFARTFREAGLKVGVLKPVETGCGRDGGRLIPDDGLALMNASGTDQPLEEVVPYQLEAPLAPLEAARRQGIELKVEKIFQILDSMTGIYDIIIMEGAGGLMVPLREHFFFIDLIKASELPALIVAPNRLGVINHTLLSIKALRERGIGLLGVVLNLVSPELDPSSEGNAKLISELGEVEVLLELPYLEANAREEMITDACRGIRERMLDMTGKEAWLSALQYMPGKNNLK
jgi:dethiobiotin synthetase